MINFRFHHRAVLIAMILKDASSTR